LILYSSFGEAVRPRAAGRDLDHLDARIRQHRVERRVAPGRVRRTTGDRHTAAQRNLFNRLIGCLHHCLATGQHYNETIAFLTDEPTSE
jgi:hypothetical protein